MSSATCRRSSCGPSPDDHTLHTLHVPRRRPGFPYRYGKPGRAGDHPGRPGGKPHVTLFLSSLGLGLVTASVLAIAAVGFTLQFAVTDVLNLAYGAIMIAGAFVAYMVNQAGLSVWIGLLAAVVVCSFGSVLLNSGVYTPFQRRGTSALTMAIVSLGITLIIEFGAQALAGGTAVSYAMSSGSTLKAACLTLTVVQIAAIARSLR